MSRAVVPPALLTPALLALALLAACAQDSPVAGCLCAQRPNTLHAHLAQPLAVLDGATVTVCTDVECIRGTVHTDGTAPFVCDGASPSCALDAQVVAADGAYGLDISPSMPTSDERYTIVVHDAAGATLLDQTRTAASDGAPCCAVYSADYYP